MTRPRVALLVSLTFFAPNCDSSPPMAVEEQFAGCYSLSWHGEVLGVFDAPLPTSLQLTTAQRENERAHGYAARARYRYIHSEGVDSREDVDPEPFTAAPTWRLVDSRLIEIDITGSTAEPGTWVLSGRDSSGVIVGRFEWHRSRSPRMIRELTFRAVPQPCL